MRTGPPWHFPVPKPAQGCLLGSACAVLLEGSACSSPSAVPLDLWLRPCPSLLPSSPSYFFAAVLWGLGKDRFEWGEWFVRCVT